MHNKNECAAKHHSEGCGILCCAVQYCLVAEGALEQGFVSDQCLGIQQVRWRSTASALKVKGSECTSFARSDFP